MTFEHSGWIALDKPSGLSSNQALSKIKRILKPKKIGYSGTLDPLATGVLPIAINEATKLASYISDIDKIYEFKVVFGEERDTYDLEGEVVNRTSIIPSKQDILRIIPDFVGEISQVPPRFSAIKVAGERSYKLARSGIVQELAARKIKVFSLKLLHFDDCVKEAAFDIHASKGTYVRSIGHDLAKKLGSLGYIKDLRRKKVGLFDETMIISLDKISELIYNTDRNRWLLPIEMALDDIPVLDFPEELAHKIRCGQKVSCDPFYESKLMVAKSGGKLISIGKVESGHFEVIRVFNL